MWFMDSVKKFWKNVKDKFNSAVDYSAKKISESSAVEKKEDVEELIEKSITTEFQNKDTWELKYFKHKSILIIADEKDKSYDEMMVLFPLLKTKAFSQSVEIMISKLDIKWIDYKKEFELEELPVMIVFENKEITKKIIWKENIEKIAKSIKMNIEELIEQF